MTADDLPAWLLPGKRASRFGRHAWRATCGIGLPRGWTLRARRQIPGKRRKASQRRRSGQASPLFSHHALIHCRCGPSVSGTMPKSHRHVRESRPCLSLSAAGIAGAQETRFAHPGVAGDAKRYEAYLKANWQPKGSARELKAEGDRVLAAGNDPRAAARAYAQAVVSNANDVDSWIGLARALLAIKPDQGAERYDLPVNASG